jgi:hypothetical protein
MNRGLAKRYNTCEVLNILEDIPSDYDNTSEESSEPDNDDDDEYVPPEVYADEELEERNNVELMEPAAPIESTSIQAKTTEVSASNLNPKQKLSSPDAKDPKKESAIAQVEYLEKYIAEIDSSQLSPQQIKHLQTTLPQLPACKSKEKLSAQQIKSLIEIAVRGWKKMEQPTQIHNFDLPQG